MLGGAGFLPSTVLSLPFKIFRSTGVGLLTSLKKLMRKKTGQEIEGHMLKQKVPNVQINSLHRYDCMGAPCTLVLLP